MSRPHRARAPRLRLHATAGREHSQRGDAHRVHEKLTATEVANSALDTLLRKYLFDSQHCSARQTAAIIPMTTQKPSGSAWHRDDGPGFAGLSINDDHRGLGEEIELGRRGPRVGTHDVRHDEIAIPQPREVDLIVDHIDAVAGRTGEHCGLSGTSPSETRDRVGRVLVVLSAEQAIYAVVQVIPPASRRRAWPITLATPTPAGATMKRPGSAMMRTEGGTASSA